MSPTSILIIEKTGSIKMLTIKEYLEEDLYKKCGFKKADGFQKQTEWTSIFVEGNKYSISLFAKTCGKLNTENKYEFPLPIVNELFFGNCALVCSKESGIYSLTIDLWEKIKNTLKCLEIKNQIYQNLEPLELESELEIEMNLSDIGSELSEEEYEE
jgi:hypothetical protein